MWKRTFKIFGILLATTVTMLAIIVGILFLIVKINDWCDTHQQEAEKLTIILIIVIGLILLFVVSYFLASSEE